MRPSHCVRSANGLQRENEPEQKSEEAELAKKDPTLPVRLHCPLCLQNVANAVMF